MWTFHYRGLECKSRKSRNTWSNRQIWPWGTNWSRAKVNRVLPGECTGHCKHPFPTTQEKTLHMDITRWSIPKWDWLHPLQPKMDLRKHHYEQNWWRWWNFSWAISNPKRWSYESAALYMPANLENSAVATRLEKVCFHSNLKERQCQRMLKYCTIVLISQASKVMLKIL